MQLSHLIKTPEANVDLSTFCPLRYQNSSYGVWISVCECWNCCRLNGFPDSRLLVCSVVCVDRFLHVLLLLLPLFRMRCACCFSVEVPVDFMFFSVTAFFVVVRFLMHLYRIAWVALPCLARYVLTETLLIIISSFLCASASSASCCVFYR